MNTTTTVAYARIRYSTSLRGRQGGAFIGGQQQTIGVGASNSGIFSGYGHTVLGLCSLIAGGANNFIDSTPATPTAFASIGGGQQHTVCAGTNHSGIFSGFNNQVADSCASVLGGAGNGIPLGFPNAHIIGSGIVLSTGVVGNPNSLHVNGLWASAMCAYPFGYPYPIGTVFSAPIGITPPSGSVLYIM